MAVMKDGDMLYHDGRIGIRVNGEIQFLDDIQARALNQAWNWLITQMRKWGSGA